MNTQTGQSFIGWNQTEKYLFIMRAVMTDLSKYLDKMDGYLALHIDNFAKKYV